MDAFKALLADKKKKRVAAQDGSGPAKKRKRKKYVRRGEAEAARQAAYLAEKAAAEKARGETTAAVLAAAALAGTAAGDGTTAPDEGGGGKRGTEASGAEAAAAAALAKLDDERAAVPPRVEVIRRLRVLGEPITLFGEENLARFRRLQAVEAGGGELVTGKKEDFHASIRREEEQRREAELLGAADGEMAAAQKKIGMIDTDVYEHPDRDPKNTEEEILFFLLDLLRLWGEELNARPDRAKRTTAGKRETATHKQCYSHIKPFFKLLRRKKSPKDILRFVKKIVDLMQAREYLQANDFYVRMAIGNSPWPIGVTRAGIHVRAADERISTANVAHVLNNELQRKYIQSLKRLMTYCQKIRPTDPSRSVG